MTSALPTQLVFLCHSLIPFAQQPCVHSSAPSAAPALGYLHAGSAK